MSDLAASQSSVEGHGKEILAAAEVSDAPPSTVAVEHDKAPPKVRANDQLLDIPLQSAYARASSDRSLCAADNANEGRAGRLLTISAGPRLASRSPAPPTTWKGKATLSWSKNKGLALVCLAQLFGVMMNVTTRLLEIDGRHGHGMHPFQVCMALSGPVILFARMSITLVLSCIYQWWAKVESAPFGPKGVWLLLVARGFGGFFGVYGLYYSLQFLPLADATVITFLAPTVACWACSVLIHEPFTRSEQIAGVISFFGVVLIARPTSFLPKASQAKASPISTGTDGGMASTNATTPMDLQIIDNVTPTQRLGAVGVALTGVLGAACAYTTIRWIGKRAHPLISVNYFAAWCTIVSTVALLAIPSIGFRLPASLHQWIYLLFLGICGFVMQFLLTAGLAYERSSRATNMVYTQMLFALAFDKLVWNTSPGLLSILGSSLILGSALYVAVHNNKVKEGKNNTEGRRDEEVGLMVEDQGEHDDSNNEAREPLRGLQEVQLRTLRV
ncbi:MAG: hypothetical protein Q9217_000379 [Psora testacea]